MTSKCAVCSKPASKRCSGCQNVFYCSIDHQKSHWKTSHKRECKVYVLKRNEVMGRYIVAGRDIPAGTVIMDEAALVIGPKQDSIVICLGCYKKVDGSYLCSKCGLPVCNASCEEVKQHAQNECKIFSKKKPLKITDYSKHHPVYQSILTVRCLCLKENDPKRWEQLHKMEHHNSMRKELKELWDRNENNTVRFLKDVYKLDFDDMVIHSVIGYGDINAFEILTEGVEICGLFPEVALMAHDCISNTHHSITDDSRMIVRNTVAIKKGEMITTTYTHTLDGTLDRRRHIKESKLFDCLCERCSSPTELGTYFSAIKCSRCSPGYVLPKDSLNPESVWVCDNCSTPMLVEEVKILTEQIKEEISEAQMSTEDWIPKLESLLAKYSGTILHTQHNLMISILHSLSQFYGRVKGYTLPELSLEQLERKEELCRSLLKVLDIIEPGLSRIRGSTLYELHAAIFFPSQIKYKSNLLEVSELKSKLEEVIHLLETSSIILGFDSPSSAAGKIGCTIPDSLKSVRQILEHFCSSSE